MALFDYPSTAQDIGKMASWPASRHIFEKDHILALRAAQATGRPLLVRGEAGTGKSQLAHAAAFVTGRAFLPVVVSGETSASDLHWKFDAIARLADAQMAGQPGAKLAAELSVAQYLHPGPLWWALNWQDALQQQQGCRHASHWQPQTPAGWQAEHGMVLLIDEIDKAEPDLPNGLLEALANGAFEVPLLGKTVEQSDTPPLIVITTNDERELPAAFLRRCLVITIALPEQDDALLDWLLARGQLHFPSLSPKSMQDAASMLIDDRKAAKIRRCYQPGLAEYLDLLRALQQLGAEGETAFKTLKQFYFDKQPVGDTGGY